MRLTTDGTDMTEVVEAFAAANACVGAGPLGTADTTASARGRLNQESRNAGSWAPLRYFLVS